MTAGYDEIMDARGDRLNPRHVLILLAATWLPRAALLAGIAWCGCSDFGPTSPEARTSGDGYTALAETIRRTGRFAFADDAPPTLHRGPAYPAAIAAATFVIRDVEWAAAAVNAFLAPIVTLVVYAFGRRLYGDRSALAIALVASLYPAGLWYTASPFSDSFLTAVFCLYAWLALRSLERPSIGWAAPAGAGLAALLLTKPFFLILPPVVVGYALVLRRRWLGAALLHAVIGLMLVAPWAWRNHRVSGQWVPLATGGGFNLLVGTLMTERSGDCNRVFHEARDEALEVVSAQTGRHWTREDILTGSNYDLTPQQDAEFAKAGVESVRESPARLPRKIAVNLARFWWFASSDRKMAMLAAMNVPVVLLGFWELARRRRDQRELSEWIALLVVTTWAGYAAIIVHSRFFLPLIPLLIAPALGRIGTLTGLMRAPAGTESINQDGSAAARRPGR